MAELASSARRASHGQVMSGLARLGLAARAFVYIVIGWLAIQIARGHGRHEANQRGAVSDLAQHSFGILALWLLGIGFTAYAIWRLSEAAFGTAAEGKKLGSRLRSLVRAIIYGAFAVTTFAFIAGSSTTDQSQQQETLTARLMNHGYGRWVVGLVGLVVLAVGSGMIVEGVSRKFEKQLRMHEFSGRTRRVVRWLGVIGNTARGIVVAIAGVLVIDAAISFNPHKSTGLDGALRTLADRPFGPALLGVLAAGLIIFGIYGFAAARWAKT